MIDKKRALKQFHALKKLGKEIRLAADGWDAEWKTLIATIMSAQTKDSTTIPVAQELFRKYGSVRKLARARVSDVKKMIRRVNFHKTKAKNVVSCCAMLEKEFNGKVPHDIDKLVTLPGVGRKTANVFLAVYGKSAIGVDTHLTYISNYLGWANSNEQKKIEEALEKLFPKRLWSDLNWVLVRFGQTYTSRRKKNEILDKIREIK